jgi:hypothetical protein
MPDKNKKFGDEEFIYQLSMNANGAQSDKPEDGKNIMDGYVIFNEEEILFKQKNILNKILSIMMPEIFAAMPKAIAEIKYPSINRPDLIYTNSETTINFSISHREDEASNDDIPEVKDMLEQMVMRMYPASSVIESKSLNVGEKNIGYFDFITPAIDMNIYNMTFILSLEERLALGSFNCPEEDMDDWKPVFIQMLQSIRIN